MATATVDPKLAVKLTATSAGMRPAFDDGTKRVIGFKKVVDSSARSTTAATAATARKTQAVQQLAFGLQDATSVYDMAGGGVKGFRVAVNAASNNVIQFASMLNPLYGTVAALGIGLGSILIPRLFKTKDGFDEAGKAAEEFQERLKRARDAAEQQQDRRASINRILTSGPNAQIAEQADLRKQREEALQKMRETAAAAAVAREEMQTGVFRGDEEMQKRGREELNKLSKEFEASRARVLDLDKRIALSVMEQQRQQKEINRGKSELLGLLAKERAVLDSTTAREKARLQAIDEAKTRETAGQDVFREVERELDPRGARIAEIQDEFNQRREKILSAGFSESDTNRLLARATESANRKLFEVEAPERERQRRESITARQTAIDDEITRLRELDRNQPRALGPPPELQGAELQSREGQSAINRALRGADPAVKRTEAHQKRIETLLAEQKRLQQELVKKVEPPRTFKF